LFIFVIPNQDSTNKFSIGNNMETIIINIKTQKDKLLFTSLANRLHLKSKVLTEEDKEDYSLLKAMLEAKEEDYVDRETIMKSLRK
jgi:hypothetical protein